MENLEAKPGLARDDVLRLLGAGVCSHVGAPYGAARFIIRYMLGGGFDWGYGLFSAAMIALGAWLAWGRLRDQSGSRIWLYSLVAIVLWYNISILLLSVAADSAVPTLQLAGFWSLGNAWVAWLVWGNSFCRLPGFALGLIICVAGVAVHWSYIDITGLTGDTRVEFAWRHRPREVPTAEVDQSEVIADVGRIVWREYLGPGRAADLEDVELVTDWNVNPPIELWRVDCGLGWGSFSATETTLFGQEQLDGFDCVVARSIDTGELQWVSKTETPGFVSAMGGDGPRATPTLHVPSNESGGDLVVFAIGPFGLLKCLDACTGDSIWEASMETLFPGENLVHGVCGSPLIVGENVVVCPPAPDGPCVAAFRVADGELAWKAQGKQRSSYASPQLLTVAGKEQVVFHASPGALGIDPEDGTILWNYDFTNEWDNNATQVLSLPEIDDELVVATGYKGGAARIQISTDGDGFAASKVWESRSTLRTKFCNLTLFDKLLISLDNGILVGVDVDTGKRRWKRGRYGHGQLLKVGRHLIVIEEFGKVCLLEPGEDGPGEIGTFEVFSRKTWNHPILIEDRLYLRNDREIVCLQLQVKEAVASEAATEAAFPKQ